MKVSQAYFGHQIYRTQPSTESEREKESEMHNGTLHKNPNLNVTCDLMSLTRESK